MRRLILSCLFITFFIAPALAANRVALVIGNSDYQHVTPLINPSNDAALMEAALTAAGFTVVRQDNLDQKGMKKAMLEFGRALKNGAEASMFYYAGHGIEIDGKNYLVPVDADIQNKEEADLQNVEVNDFLALMENSDVPLNIVVLDACRNNPFRSMRGASGGLAPVLAPSGTYVAYSTAAGKVAADGTGENSPFTKALAETIVKPGLLLESVFKQTRTKVKAATNEEQVPYDSSAIEGDFYFIPAVAVEEPKVIEDVVVVKPAVVAQRNTLRVSSDGSADFQTIAQAVASAKAGDRIEIMAGNYNGGIVVDKPLEIVGVADRTDILWEADDATVIEWRAATGLISNLKLVQTHDDSTRLHAIAFVGGSARLENSDLSSQSDAVVLVKGFAANPTIEGNKIHAGNFDGILVASNAMPTIQNNEIESNRKSGIALMTKADATISGNFVRNNGGSGIVITSGATSRISGNEIGQNANGIVVSQASIEVFDNQIISNSVNGIAILAGGGGKFTGNVLKNNTESSWSIATEAGKVSRSGNSK